MRTTPMKMLFNQLKKNSECEFPLVAQVPLLEQQSEAFERCRHMRLREPREKAGRDFTRALLP